MAQNFSVNHLSSFPDSENKMPVLFIGHGSPTNAINANEFSKTWIEIGKSLPRPRAILCISAHWETDGTLVTAMEKPRTIYDFYGFPSELYRMQYPAPGSPQLADLVREKVKQTKVELDQAWGLDHGCWSVLCRLFPEADIPVVQLSLDRTKEPSYHYQLGRELKALRKKGILILGSGNIVHNLGMMTWEDTAFDWAVEFDEQLKKLITNGDHDSIMNYQNLGQSASLAIPTNEHFLPLLYVLALQENVEELKFFNEKVTLGSISMRCVMFG
jgi:4,5-DOPA dioxygenase extradiol